MKKTNLDPRELMQFVDQLHRLCCMEDIWFREIRAQKWMDEVLPWSEEDEEIALRSVS
jgi:hypothetical protein